MPAKLKIRLDEDGNQHIDVNGVEGSSCETITEALIRSMDGEAETTYKEEYVQELPDYINTFEE